MKKNDIALIVAEQVGLTNKNAVDVVNVVFSTIEKGLSEGKEIAVSGFGKFKSVKSAERNGVNPKTGEKIKIAARNRVQFKVAKSLKEAING